MTFSIEFHRWQTGRSSDLFYVWIRLGFFSLAFSKQRVSDALRNIERRLKDADEAEVHGEVVRVPHFGGVM